MIIKDDYIVKDSDNLELLEVDTTEKNIMITLPTSKKGIIIKNIGDNTVCIVTDELRKGETIEFYY